MNWKRRKKLMLRWSILTAVLIALFWTMYYLIVGSVPVVSSIKMTPDSTLTLPFAISRWWDILLGPLFSCIFVLFFTSRRITKDKDLVGINLGASLVVGLFFGLISGLLVVRQGVSPDTGLVSSLALGLGVSLISGLLVVRQGVSPDTGLVGSLIVGPGVSLVSGLFVGLGVSLALGLGVSLVFSLFVGLGASLGAGLVIGLDTLLKYVLSKSKKFWKTAGDWLMAR